MLACQGRKIRDNAPETRAAGKQIPREHGTKECLVQEDGGRVTPNAVKCTRGATRPEAGTSWSLWRRMGGPPVDTTPTHGVTTKSSEKVKDFVNPPLVTKFKQNMLNRLESGYLSKKMTPLGTSHDQQAGLPAGMDTTNTCFGIATVKSDSVAMTVSPQKTREEVNREHEEGRDLYKKSHNTWEVGEIVDRNYDWSKFSKGSLYGVETPHDNSGSQVRTALHWLQSIEGRVIAKRLDEFREKSQPQLGQVHDPIAETLMIPPDHTFGVMVHPDEYNAGYLLHSNGSTIFSECLVLDEGVLAVIRNILKQNNFHNFHCFLDALQNLDKEGCGTLPEDVIREMSFQFGLPLTSDMLEMLIHWCSVEGGGKGELMGRVAYEEFIMLMDWKAPIQVDRLAHTKKPSTNGNATSTFTTATTTPVNDPLTPKGATPTQLETTTTPTPAHHSKITPKGTTPTHVDTTPTSAHTKLTPKGAAPTHPDTTPTPAAGATPTFIGTVPTIETEGLRSNYRTSSQSYRASAGVIPTHHLRSYGVPSIRSDLPAPRIKRVADTKNYGDESTCYNLLYPSIYANHGVFEADFFEPRTQEQLRRIFDGMEIHIPPEVFEELWIEAVKRDSKGEVSVESFREVVQDLQRQHN